MAANGPVRQGTKQFMRQGHTTADAVGANINATPKGKMGNTPREVKP